MRVRQLVVRARAEVTEDGEGRQGRQGDGAEQGVADQRTALDAGFLDDVVDDPDGGLAVVLGADRVALFRDLVVRHEGLGPVDDAGADAEHRERGADAQQRVLEADRGDRGVVPRSIAKYATRKIRVPTTEMTNRAATCRSARFSALGSVSARRKRCGGSPGSWNFSTSF